MTFTLHAAIESARRIEEARKRSLAAVHGQERRVFERSNHLSAGSLANMTIRMLISDWSRDEFGNLTRTIRAAE